MIPNETPQKVETIGATSPVGSFHITTETQARILVSLSDKMYTRKELAVIREYSTNSADAHMVVGKPISDIQVFFPTMLDLNYRIRDYGTGLTEEEVRTVYSVFGESTKRNSNEFNGVLGYGCKVGFAHADSFTLTSWNGGCKRVYQCIKGDSTTLPSIIRLSCTESNEPSGIEVCVPVKQASMWTFHREAIEFYRYWPELPTLINLTEEEQESLNKFRTTAATLKGDGWEVRLKTAGVAKAYAYMGWVPYKIDWNVLYHKMSLDSKSRVLFELLQNNDVILYFKMGEINFVDSREQLEYTDVTFNALVTRIEEIFTKIKSSIQEKFNPLTTIWDAKIMYNAIFGTGVLELEKGESDGGDDTITCIKILDGNLTQLEHTFQDAFTWNGISINSSYFRNINRFDNADSTKIQDNGDHDPVFPVMVTYRKKKSRLKANRCKGESNNGITASNRVAVVINDTGRKSGQAVVARHLIFGNTHYKTVYILTFATSEIKTKFYNFFNFETVPTLNLSDLIDSAKNWNNTNKVTRSYGNGGGGTRAMQYLNLENGQLEESNVPIREIENGGIYIDLDCVSRRTRHGTIRTMVKTTGYETINAESCIGNFKWLAAELDLDVDRIYIISKQTSEAKWFRGAIESGEWTNIWTMIKENLSNFTMDVAAMVDAEAYKNATTICKEAADLLVPQILDRNSPILKLIAMTSGKNYDAYAKMKAVLDSLCLWNAVKGNTKGTVDFNSVANAVMEVYPFINWNELEREGYLVGSRSVQIARYINSTDVFNRLTDCNSGSAAIDVVSHDNCLATMSVS